MFSFIHSISNPHLNGTISICIVRGLSINITSWRGQSSRRPLCRRESSGRSWPGQPWKSSKIIFFCNFDLRWYYFIQAFHDNLPWQRWPCRRWRGFQCWPSAPRSWSAWQPWRLSCHLEIFQVEILYMASVSQSPILICFIFFKFTLRPCKINY